MKGNFNHKGFFDKEAAEMRERILNTPNTEELYEIKGTKYYVSNSGCDKNDGLTPETAIKTFERLEEFDFQAGDAVLFKRGDTFRLVRQFNTESDMIFGSYGVGEKPKLYGSARNYATAIWKKTKDTENVWETNCYDKKIGGVIINDGEYIGVMKLKMENLTENDHFFHNKYYRKVYLYCDRGNPAEVYKEIEIISDTQGLTMNEGICNNTYDNICFKYSWFPTYAYGLNDGIHFTNCEACWIGGCGSPHPKVEILRLGNGFGSWNGGADTVVDNCWIHQVFDSAVSWQGHIKQDLGIEYVYKDIYYTNNLFEYNNCDMEFFDRAGTSLVNFHMENNIMRFTSLGWGTTSVEGKIRCIEGCIRAHTNGMDKIEDVYFTNNIMDCPARQTINWDVDPWQWEGIHTSGTKLYIKKSYRTLEPMLQGLQTEEGQEFDRRFATTYDELVEGFKIFEQGADIYMED